MINPIFSARSSLIQITSNIETPEIKTYVKKYDEILDKVGVIITTDENSDKKSPNYFDSKNTSICYYDKKHGDIELQIRGKGREEDITVLKNGNEVCFSKEIKKDILSMTGTFPHHRMHFLGSISSQESHPEKELLPYIEINDNNEKYGLPTSAQELSDIIDFRIRHKKSTNEIIVPVLSNKDHWFMLSFSIDSKLKVTKPVITNTTHEARAKGNLSHIMDGYRNILTLAQETIDKSHTLAGYTLHTPNFCQSLQYGNMGCGITTSLNEQSLLSGEMKIESLKFTNDSFRTPEEALSLDVFHQGNKHSFKGERANLIQSFMAFSAGNKVPLGMIENSNYSQSNLEEDFNSMFNGSLSLIEIEINDSSLPLLKSDTSQRSNLVLESIRRVDLAFNSFEMEHQKETLHRELEQYFFNKSIDQYSI